jgi:integrase
MTMMRKPPKFTHGYIDCRGKARFYFRKSGFPKVSLPGLPWSPEFMAAYEQALKATEKPANAIAQIGADHVVPRSMRALAIAYYDSAAFSALKPTSQTVYRSIIDGFCRETGKDGKLHGDLSAVTMQTPHVEKLMDARKDKPDSANGLRKVLRELFKLAKKQGWRNDDPTQGVAKIKPKNKGGFHRWSDAEIAQFEARHPVGSKPRLAMALGLFTGQARQDVIAMGPQYISDGVLNWIRKKTEDKTGFELSIPVHPELRRIIDATPSGHLNFLTTEFGKPFSADGFGGWFREQCDKAGLPHCTFHGLRKAAASRLAEAGCTTTEIAAITGHASLKEVQRYTETYDRRQAAKRAMLKLVGGEA